MPTHRVAILGSTGSIGVQALQVIDSLNADPDSEDRYQVVALIAHRNAAALAQQARRYSPHLVGLTDHAAAATHARTLEDDGAKAVLVGPEALTRAAAHSDVDIVLHAVLGAAGLEASFAAAESGKRLALANKESLVVGGSLLLDAARRGGSTILPIDSEHSAVFQAMQCGRRDEVERIILTASGGPFRDWPIERMRTASVEDALAHPTWTMGSAITVGSATLFNKALELIEAVRLFDLPPQKVEVVIHPESIIHSMVEFRDGSTIAQLSPPDMKTPISYALTWPGRGRAGGRRMDWSRPQSWRFEPPDEERFPALRLARHALDAGGSTPATLNAAHEVAVQRFLARKLAFGRISEVVERALQQAPPAPVSCLDDLLAADARARRIAGELADRLQLGVAT